MNRLTGRKLVLTRSAEDSADWAEALAAEGALPILLPCIETEAASDPDLKAKITAALANTDWIVFTSRRGVDAFQHLVETAVPAATRVAAVGKATAQSCEQYFGRADLVGSGTAETLGEDLAREPSIKAGAHCLLALAANAGRRLQERLSDAGAMVSRYDVYRTLPAQPVETKRNLSTLGSDTVIFASPTAVIGFDNQIDVDIDQRFVTIGPSTSAAVRAHDWKITAEAKEPSLSGIIQSMMETDHV